MHWAFVAAVELHGQPHALMEADLAFYPPAASDALSLYVPARAFAPPAPSALEAA
jgi:hypothetical protein